MCGIFMIAGDHKIDDEKVEYCFNIGKGRGPEYSHLASVSNIKLGFHRLAINGWNTKEEFDNANQPFNINGVYLICNGEIYNHKEIIKTLDITTYSKSDCESIIHLYLKYGIEQTLQILDGVFAFVLVDTRDGYNKIYASRDQYGVRPLFILQNKKWIALASEMKQLTQLSNETSKVVQFTPGDYMMFEQTHKVSAPKFKSFYKPTIFSNISLNREIEEYAEMRNRIYTSLYNAVKKRVENTEREIACLLSGGLDSSLVASIVKQCLPNGVKLHTWSIGLEGSEDLKYAQKVADHIGSIHHNIIVSESEMLNVIPEVIYAIESYDTTTVRASIFNWLICKKIKEQSEAKVIFNGDGSDEVMGGYLYFHKAPDPIAFDKECRRLLSNIHYFDVLRSDRSISSHGLEARTPFLDKMFVQNYLSIDCDIRDHAYNFKCEKYLIREIIHDLNPDLLPYDILFRTKEAFSDGVSKQERSWYDIIKEFTAANNTTEKEYYKSIFDKLFPNENPIPYMWMPQFIANATDASARTLDIYSKLYSLSVNDCK